MKELKNLKDTVEQIEHLSTQYEDIETLIEMGNEEDDESMAEEIRSELDSFTDELETLRISTLLTGEYDKNGAILKLNAGAGGTESCDWCSMLYRMYTRWAERKGFTLEVLDYLDGDEAGIKSVTFQVNGENAEVRKRSTPPRAHLPLQCTGKTPDLLRIPGCYAGYRRRPRY